MRSHPKPSSTITMGPETWEAGKDTPVNLREYKSKFEKIDQLHDNEEQKNHVKELRIFCLFLLLFEHLEIK